MKPSARILLTAVFILLSLSAGSQKKQKTKYTDFNYGEYYLFTAKKPDSAFLKFSNYVNAPDNTLNKGKAYSYMGEILWDIGDLYGAQENLTYAFHTLDSLDDKNHEELGEIYNLLGNVTLDLKLYDEAIKYYNLAIRFIGKPDQMLESMNGKATAFQKKRNYGNAIAIYDSILRLNPHNQQVIVRTIDNRAITKWLQDPSYPALQELHSVLKIRLDSQSNKGLDASYAHLSDYYAAIKPDSALWYAKKMLETSKENKNPNDVLEAIDKLVMLNNSPAQKEFWYEEYKSLNDSIRFSRDTTRTRFADIRYDYQRTRANNLELKQHITRQELLILGLTLAAIVTITWLSVRYNKRRKKQREESEIAIRDSKLKTSQKVHDVVANGLYVIMNELEHVKEIEKEPLMNRIEGLYEKSRDISYEDAPSDNDADHHRRVHDLLTSFANEQTKLIIVGNEPKFWNRVSEFQKHELLLVLNEIMVNMKKHSHATNAAVQFKQELNKGFIHYTDNGVGFSDAVKFGNGLNGTVTRIKSLNGEVNFGKSGSGGASIAISFPL